MYEHFSWEVLYHVLLLRQYIDMEFLGIPLFDDDFYKLILRFSINLVFITVIIRFIYYRASKRRDYLFTYYMISIIVFFICFTLKKFELNLGMALGLFAIFGILRYRTSTIKIKEMTYLFVVIGLSVINALVNKKTSYAELAFLNIVTVIFIYILEYMWVLPQVRTQDLVYDNLENLLPQNEALLRADLEARTGQSISKIKVGKIDLKASTAQISISYLNQ